MEEAPDGMDSKRHNLYIIFAACKPGNILELYNFVVSSFKSDSKHQLFFIIRILWLAEYTCVLRARTGQFKRILQAKEMKSFNELSRKHHSFNII